MLSKPKHGWCNISIGDWSDRASYLTDVSMDLLNSLIQGLSQCCPNCISFDAEGWKYIIIFDSYTVHIIESKDTHILTSFDIDRITLALEVYNDISANIDAWSAWDTSICMEDENSYETLICENRQKLSEKLKELKKLLEKGR